MFEKILHAIFWFSVAARASTMPVKPAYCSSGIVYIRCYPEYTKYFKAIASAFIQSGDSSKAYKTTDFTYHTESDTTYSNAIGTVIDQRFTHYSKTDSLKIIQHVISLASAPTFVLINVEVIKPKLASKITVNKILQTYLNNQNMRKQLYKIHVPATNDFDEIYQLLAPSVKGASYEVTSLIDSASMDTGMAIGSIDHGVWKTIINVGATNTDSSYAPDVNVISGTTYPQERGYQEWIIKKLQNGNNQLVSRFSGLLLRADGITVSQNTCSDINDYKCQWAITKKTNGYVIKNVGTDSVLDVPNSASTEGHQVIQYVENDGNNQQWILSASDDGSDSIVRIINVATKKQLSLNGASFGSGALAVQYSAKGVHGSISGASVLSPRIYLGIDGDWRTGLESYAKILSKISPPMKWSSGVPFGWNTYAAYAGNYTYDSITKVANYFKDSILSLGYQDSGRLYINIDGPGTYTFEASADTYIKNKGLIPGAYYAPAITSEESATLVPNTACSYGDIILKDDSGNYIMDRWKSDLNINVLDVTHPCAIKYISNRLDTLINRGVKYVKLDFLVSAMYEGSHYDTAIKTGMQAYNKIMDTISKKLTKNNIFVSLSLAPLFPNQYGHSRRMMSDTYADIGKVEIAASAISYGWWVNGSLYKYNDPDHFVFDKLYCGDTISGKTTEDEARTRYNLSAISGTVMINSDDISKAISRRRMKRYMSDTAINQIARSGVAFKPVYAPQISSGIKLYSAIINGEYYVAAFNFSASTTDSAIVTFGDIGLSATALYSVVDLWSNQGRDESSKFTLTLAPMQSSIWKLSSVFGGGLPHKIINVGREKLVTGNADLFVRQRDDFWDSLQLWTISSASNGVQTIKDYATANALDDSMSSQVNGTSIIEYTPNGQDNQNWILSSTDSGYNFENKSSGKRLDSPGDAEGLKLCQWTANTGLNQKWKIAYGNKLSTHDEYCIVSAVTGMAIDVKNGSTAEGSAIVQDSLTWSSSQLWKFVQDSDGVYNIMNTASSSYLDVSLADTANYATMMLYHNNGGSNQKWRIGDLHDGTVDFVNLNSNKAIDVPASAIQSGLTLIQFTPRFTPNQKWILLRK